MKNKLNVVFFGTPDFSVPTLELLSQHPDINLLAVVTMPDRPAGRGQELKSPPVAIFCKEKKIPLIQTENINRDELAIKELTKHKLDFILVLAFAQFLGSKILSMPKIGCFNIHTSILPKYRGAAPIQYALLNGDSETGVSIQKMVKEMDAGDLVHFDLINISHNETGGKLYTRLKFLAALSTDSFIEKIIHNKITYTPQDAKNVSFAPTLKKEDGFLDFKNSSFDKINNQIRALDPWPGTYCLLNNERLKVFSIEKVTTSLPPGKTSTEHGFLYIGLLDSTIRLLEIQLEGKKRVTDVDCINGFKNKGVPIIINS